MHTKFVVQGVSEGTMSVRKIEEYEEEGRKFQKIVDEQVPVATVRLTATEGSGEINLTVTDAEEIEGFKANIGTALHVTFGITAPEEPKKE